MKLPVVGIEIDERFLNHRLRSTSLAGMLSAAFSLLLFLYHLLAQRRWNIELLAVGATFVAVKLTAMLWFRITD